MQRRRDGKSEADGGEEERAEVEGRSQAAEKLTERVLEGLTGVEAQWLGGVKPVFRQLCALALSDRVSDAVFVQALEAAQREMPALFGKLNSAALEEALEKAMGTAVVNGVVRRRLNSKG
jgi:hypothetical protein